MGRSVACPSRAECTVFAEHNREDQDDWNDLLDDLRCVLKRAFPSFNDADRLAGREEHIILENMHATVVVCEYCGVISVSLVPDEWDEWEWHRIVNLSGPWCYQITKRFRKVVGNVLGETMTPIATMSNGERVYQRDGN